MAAASKKKRRVVAPRLDVWVEQKLAAMWAYSEIVDHAINDFGCSERTAKEAIARVKQYWKSAEASTVEERRAKFRAELELAWRRALEAGDYRAIAVMARTRADVEGIKATKKIEHSGVLGLRPVAAMSPQERQREIELLLAKRQGALAPGGGKVIDIAPATEVRDATPAEEIELPPDIRPGKASKPRATKKSKTRVH